MKLTGWIKYQLSPIAGEIHSLSAQLNRLELAHGTWSWSEVFQPRDDLHQ